ncbi:hypothetical protein [Natronorubrum sp. FCH18a]|uniref:hypothetical protein n=1 Tax=Natronorubrum sp. FCH18a TaxID=3447018 RepID=UPI003F515E6A
MTRKSPRELERRLDDIAGDSPSLDGFGYDLEKFDEYDWGTQREIIKIACDWTYNRSGTTLASAIKDIYEEDDD